MGAEPILGTVADLPSITLNDGTVIPQFGLGTWNLAPANTAAAVRTAVEAGYRHVDTAQMYRNEAEVGQGVRDAGVPRDDVWITTKLSGAHGYDAAVRGLEESLERLGTDHVDLYLIHSPGREGDVDTWKAFTALRADGRARSIGVSNFHARELDEIIDATGVVPSVNQVQLHPREPRRSLVRVHERLGITTESWAPLAQGRLLDDPTVVDVARGAGCTPAQALLRWHLHHGYVTFPKSADPGRIRENIGVAGVVLDDAALARIDALGRFDEPRRVYRGVRRRVRRVLGR